MFPLRGAVTLDVITGTEAFVYNLVASTQLLFCKMVRRCVAAGCSNTPSSTVILFKFPNDPVLRDKWVKQVRRTRAEWEATEHSVLCSEHFSEDCFEADAALAQSFGLSKRRRLKPDAIPTIFHRPSGETASTSYAIRKRPRDADTPTTSSIKRPRSAVEKRERARVSDCNVVPIHIASSNTHSYNYIANR